MKRSDLSELKLIDKVIGLLFFFMFLSSPVSAGERMPEGSILTEESYVFSVDEAKEIMETIEKLEFDVKKKDELISLHENLDEVNKKQKIELEELLKIRDDQITSYKDWVNSDAQRIRSLERQQKVTKFERWGFFALGIVVTGGTFIVVDKLDDKVIENN